MKMNFLFGPAFWGILIVLFGLSLILKEMGLNFPLVKVFIAIIIILFGIRLLVGGSCSIRTTNSRSSSVYHTGSSEYTVVFSSQTLDLTGVDPNSKPLEVSAVFGSGLVLLPDDINFEIESTAVFGGVDIPRKPDSAAANPKGTVRIEATAVFGKLDFVYKPHTRSRSAAYADSTFTDQGAQSD